MKNLALLNDKPLISYAIEAAKDSGVFERIILNTDNEIFKMIAERHEIELYLRPVELGSSTTKSDHVVYDFMQKHPSDILAWVNPTSPLQPGSEIRGIIQYFLKDNLDTLITVKNEQVHCVYDGSPVNFTRKEVFAQTQDLKSVQPFVYSIMMWRTKTFIELYEKQGYAFFCGRVGYYPVSKETSIIIKTKEDLILADCMMKAKEKYEVKYDKIIQNLHEVK
ncbi:MAG: hypothetical protein MRJ65_11065 [Candidatus Brocadiaceae bacterium]|nr:hypothetical protein [Candidatus Brocadiaceae bacterium]